VNKISDLIPDPKNANKGTARGRGMLETSLQKYGFGRSVLLDKNNVIMAGNKTIESAGGIGMENVRIIETDGTEIIAVKRTDLDANSKQGRELAIADNRVGEVGLEWDKEVLESLEFEGVGIADFFPSEDKDDIQDISEIEEEIEPFEKTHILLSFPPEKLILIKEYLDEIIKIEGIEYEQSSN